MQNKLIKLYGVLLLSGGVYYATMLGIQYKKIYDTWLNWAQPTFDVGAYTLLCSLYLFAVGTPLLMLVSGLKLYREKPLKLYFSLPLILFLLLSNIVGKLILVVGLGVYSYRKWLCARLT